MPRRRAWGSCRERRQPRVVLAQSAQKAVGAAPAPAVEFDEGDERSGDRNVGQRIERPLHGSHTSWRNVVRRLVRSALQQFSHVRRPKSWTMAGECKRTSFVVMTTAIMAKASLQGRT